MSFNVNFLSGSDADKDFMTCHLVTGIVARKVVDNVLDGSQQVIDEQCRNTLKNLWINNLSVIGGLPVEQEQVQLDLQSLRESKRLSEPLPPITEKGRMKKPAVYMQRPALSLRPVDSMTGIRESYVIRPSNSSNTVIDTTNTPEITIPIAPARISALSAPDHQKCTQKELKELLNVARYGTKVQVRVRETDCKTSSDDLPGAQNNSSETAHSTNQQQVDLNLSYKWKKGRICQITSDFVSVRFSNGIDIRVPWINRDVKLFRHTPPYQQKNSSDNVQEEESHQEYNFNNHSTLGESDSSNLNWNNNSNSSSSVEPGSSSAAADFLLQNFDSDSDDERSSSTKEGSQSGRAVDSLTAAFEHGDFSEFTGYDGEVERGLELCGVEGMHGTEGGSGGHEGLLGLESLLMQYQGERGNEDEDEDRGSEILGNVVRGSEGRSDAICTDQGPVKRRIVSFVSNSSSPGNGNDGDTGNTEYVPGYNAVAEQAKELKENDRIEAVCRQQDEDDYFLRLNFHSKNGTTKIHQGSYTFDYTEQKEKIETRRTLALIGVPNPDEEEEEEEEIDPHLAVERAGLLLDPEEDPTVPVPPPDACVYGRLGKFSKGSLKCSNWEFYLRDVYIHFMSEGGTDLALPRCKLKMATSHFLTPSQSFSEPVPSSVSISSNSSSGSSSSAQEFDDTAATRREKRRLRRENIPSVIAI